MLSSTVSTANMKSKATDIKLQMAKSVVQEKIQIDEGR